VTKPGGHRIEMRLVDEERGCVANDKWVGECIICKKAMLKKKMTTILVKTQYSNPKTIGHICEVCACFLCDEYEISM